MKMLDHTNVTTLLHYFYTEGEKAEETYLNLVMDFVPQTVYSMSRQYAKAKKAFPTLFMKLYTYQLCRSLAYIHSLGVCHRDIKPQNLLVHPETHMLKLCDFGSAKILVKGEPNVSYICSRYYRAPELIFGATDYTCCIDVWSAGCVLAELLLGVPLFPGESGVDQLVEIIKVLGTPSLDEIQQMNQNYSEYKFPQVKQRLHTLTLLHHHHSPSHHHHSPLTITPSPLTSPLTTHHPTAGQAAPVVQGLPPAHADRRDRPRRQIPKVRPCFAKPFSPSNTLLLLHATPHSTHSTHLPTLPYPTLCPPQVRARAAPQAVRGLHDAPLRRAARPEPQAAKQLAAAAPLRLQGAGALRAPALNQVEAHPLVAPRGRRRVVNKSAHPFIYYPPIVRTIYPAHRVWATNNGGGGGMRFGVGFVERQFGQRGVIIQHGECLLRRRGVCGEGGRGGDLCGGYAAAETRHSLSLLAPICNLRSPPRGRDVENWRSAARLRGAGVWRVARATTCEEMLSCERWRGDSDAGHLMRPVRTFLCICASRAERREGGRAVGCGHKQ